MAEQEISVGNPTYDKQTEMLQRFEINLGPNVKPLPVDLQEYQGETVENTKQLREDFLRTYQAAIEKDPGDAKKYFSKIAHDFPNGISWQAPGEEGGQDKAAETLRMEGVPNSQSINSEGAARQFMWLHGEWASMVLKTSQADVEPAVANLGNLQGASAAINQGDHFTDEQKSQLNSIMVSNLKQNGFYTEETQVQEQQLDQSAQRAFG